MAQLPAIQINPNNALVDFSPINNAIDQNRQDAFRNNALQMQNRELGMRQQQHDYQMQRDRKNDAHMQVERAGKMAFAIQQMPDSDPAKAAAWQRYLKSYGDGDHTPEEMDFRTGPKLAAAAAGQFLDPLEQQAKQLRIQSLQSNLSTDNMQRQKLQFEMDQARTAAAQGKLIDGEKPLVKMMPDGTVKTMYTPPRSDVLGPYKDMKQRADVEEGLRKEYANIAKPYFDVRDAYARINQSAKDPSAAGDLALIFNYMKMLDPGSVVREGEFATAQNAAGIPDRIRNMWNKALSGERLNENQRNDFVSQSRGLMSTQEKQYQKIQGQYRAIAGRVGADPSNVFIDFSAPQQEAPSVEASQTPISTDQARQAPDGNWYVPDPSRPGKYLMVKP